MEAVENAELYGIVGCISEPVNGALVYTIFVLLLLEFRTKAPGAQTIAQFVGRRFGIVAHILTITFCLLTGLYTLSINVIVGSKILDAVTKGVSKTAIISTVFILVGAMVIVARRRSYSVVLYIIITTVLLICNFLILIVLNVPTYSPLGSVESFYKLLVCYNRSDQGIGSSLIGGFDDRRLVNSLVNLILRPANNLPSCFPQEHVVRVVLDQALWEASINLPPNHGVLGLLLAIIMAFCIPFAFGIVCGLGFQALESAFFNAALLNETQKDSGLVLFATPIHLLDKSGVWVMFIVILLLLVTSCMFSIVGVSSILYHDVLATYIRPFKRQTDGKTCLLCGKRRGHLASQRNICRCRSMLECAACHTDTWIKEECKNRPATTLVYGCQTHGLYSANRPAFFPTPKREEARIVGGASLRHQLQKFRIVMRHWLSIVRLRRAHQ
ncbi:putative urea active transporter 1 [Taenia crassiceps]|uniref:Urea active transporter 1 n=1 Tax=Taenia crassiceps TaxID=6207 RepID=A0ABR4QMS5_9CEST